ncbi:MAG: bifunctional riboflavin kinase/FAD synthetase [bacterium]
MKTTSRLSTLKSAQRPICIAAGFFDGLHRGHRAVLLSTIAAARECAGAAWVLTFETHPMKTLCPERAPLMLTCDEHKKRLLCSLGMDGCLMLRFNRSFANMTPEEFADELCGNVPSLQTIVVGSNWRFGRNGTGNHRNLRNLMKKRGVSVIAVDPLVWHGQAISSTRIRTAVARGKLGAACGMLGRPFSVLGTVMRGRGIGKTIGFPTANLAPCNEVRPPDGVYAVQADIGLNMVVDGVMNIGTRPTFSSEPNPVSTLELFLPEFSGNLYGRTIEVFFINKIRNEQKFASPAALARQIARDVKEAVSYLKKAAQKII